MAARQWGQISVAQLHACRLTEKQIRVRVRAGRLHPGPRGVYAVGVPAATVQARAMAATLAVRDAVLGAASAADVWGLWRNTRSHEVVFGRGRKREDLDVRRGRLDPEDVAVVHGIRITTLARTLLDLAAELSERQLLAALARARVDHRLDDGAIRDVLARHPRHAGTARLGRALTGPRTESGLERRFLARLEGLPQPQSQVRIGPDRCDFVFADARLAVEIDGPHHAGEWARDAAKDARLLAAGWRVLRLTRWDVERDGARTRARALALLSE